LENRLLNFEIAPGVHQLTVRGANMYLVVEDSLTLIDTAFRGTGPLVMDFIRRLGRKPEELKLVVITHNHIDHIGGLTELRKEASFSLAMSQDDLEESGEAFPGEPLIPRAARVVFAARHGVVDMPLKGGEVLDVLGGLRVINAPGHTPGSIALLSEKMKLLFVGDTVRKRRDVLFLPYKLASYDMTKARETVKTLSALDFEMMCFGHGRPLSNGVRDSLIKLANAPG
jgi:glyoxylase-like metal-dependent hydrolase (beta-lactamase superfamily II)